MAQATGAAVVLTVNELAAMLNTSPSSIYRFNVTGKIPRSTTTRRRQLSWMCSTKCPSVAGAAPRKCRTTCFFECGE